MSASAHEQVDYMSRLTEEMETHPIDDRLIDGNFFLVIARPGWYSEMIEFLTIQQL